MKRTHLLSSRCALNLVLLFNAFLSFCFVVDVADDLCFVQPVDDRVFALRNVYYESHVRSLREIG